jgi:hypothetical protein
METIVDDNVSIIFSSHFYQSLAFGRSVREAFDLANNQLELEGIKNARTPKLLVREGVDASKPFVPER